MPVRIHFLDMPRSEAIEAKIQAPADLKRLAQAVEDRIRQDCPEVRWRPEREPN